MLSPTGANPLFKCKSMCLASALAYARLDGHRGCVNIIEGVLK